MGGSNPYIEVKSNDKPPRRIKSHFFPAAKPAKSIPTNFRMGTTAYRAAFSLSEGVQSRPRPRRARRLVPALLATEM